MSSQPYIVGICGGSASGKTFLSRQLLARFPKEKITFLSLDEYYKPKDQQVHDEEGLVNWDHPRTLSFDELVKDIESLVRGETIQREEYTFNNPHAIPAMLTFRPAPVIVVEGLFILHEKALRDLFNLKVFVDADEHIRLDRRLRRDTTERGQTMDQVLTDYTKYVAPMYEQFVSPQRQHCDLIVPNNKHMYKALDVLVNHLAVVLEGE
ncbi:MAG: uridine kinase [Bacteroidia bacterium]